MGSALAIRCSSSSPTVPEPLISPDFYSSVVDFSKGGRMHKTWTTLSLLTLIKGWTAKKGAMAGPQVMLKPRI